MTPTSFVNVTKWTRTHTNKLLFEGGFGIYNQEYTELYQPNVTGIEDKVWDEDAIRNSRVYNVVDHVEQPPGQRLAQPGGSLLGAAHVHGRGLVRRRQRTACACGVNCSNGDWRLADDVDRRRAADHLQRRRAGHRSRCACRRTATTASSATSASMLQDRWSMGRVTLNLGFRYDQFIGESRESTVLPSRFGARRHVRRVLDDGTVDPGDLCTGEVQNWKDISPRVGFAMDVFGDGRTALKASYARYVAGQAIAFANQVNPIGALTAIGHARVARPRRQRPAARCRRQHPVRRADQLGVDADVRPPHGADDPVLAGPAPRLGQARLQQRSARSRCSTSSRIASR